MKIKLFPPKKRKINENGPSHRKDYLLNDKTPFDITEAFRNLKATISVSVPKRESGGISLFLTSAYPEDGKTTVTVNLGLMFALSDMKVVIVDADIRKGRVAKFFKHRSSPGLSEYLSGQNSLDEVLVQSDINENLYFMPCGTHSPKPYELLESDAMKGLSEKLREKFDYVIYDTPPVLVVSDAIAIAPNVDGAILVCRHMSSYMNDISRSLQALEMGKVNVIGTVVNGYEAEKVNYSRGYKKYYYDSKKKYGYKRGYGRGYGYGYGYGPRVESEEKAETAVEKTEEEPQETKEN